MQLRIRSQDFEYGNQHIIFHDSASLTIAVTSGWDSEYRKEEAANAARIVSCVNALAGLNPDAIKELVEAAAEVYDHAKKYGAAPFSADKMFGRLEQALKNLKEE